MNKAKRAILRALSPILGRRYVLFDQSQTYNMSFNEVVGAIFVRSQFIEEMMRRMLILDQNYKPPKNFDEKTFGGLLNDLKKVYPDINDLKTDDKYIMPGTTMYEDLDSARTIRNEAAHGDYLVGLTVLDLLHNYGSRASRNRFILKGMRKSLWVMDYCMIDFSVYCSGRGMRDFEFGERIK